MGFSGLNRVVTTPERMSNPGDAIATWDLFTATSCCFLPKNAALLSSARNPELSDGMALGWLENNHWSEGF